MLTLLGSLLGFGTSIVPSIMKMFTASADRKHELAIMDRQMKMQEAGHNQRLAEIAAEADIAESQALYKHDAPSGVKWVDALRSSVRPVITYAFFALFAAVKGSGLYILIVAEGMLVAEALPKIWDGETAALFAAVMSFWFGQRAMKHFWPGR